MVKNCKIILKFVIIISIITYIKYILFNYFKKHTFNNLNKDTFKNINKLISHIIMCFCSHDLIPPIKKYTSFSDYISKFLIFSFLFFTFN